MKRFVLTLPQECKSCGINVYPHKQKKLDKSAVVETEEPHPQELCEMCKKLGFYCRELSRRSDYDD